MHSSILDGMKEQEERKQEGERKKERGMRGRKRKILKMRDKNKG